MKFRVLAFTVGSLCSLGCSSSDSQDEPAKTPIRVSGDAFSFTLPGTPYGRIAGATVSVLESPGVETTTDMDGHFVIDGLHAGDEATFTLSAAGFPAAQTKTFTLPATDLERVTFQIPAQNIYDLLAQVLGITPDPQRCQLVTTITRAGKSIYDAGAHGEAGATVTSDPPLEGDQAPVYFNAQVIPDRTLSESSEDGGVVWTNVPPGEYTLTAHKDGVSFEPLHMKCRAGVLLNASPPFGLQALE